MMLCLSNPASRATIRPGDSSKTPHRRRAARPGLTLIEVVAATALLTGLATIVLGAVSFMEAASARERHQLQAMEVAHRIVAQYIDNPKLLPDESLPIQQGESYYRYAIQEDVLMQEQEAGSKIRRATSKQKSNLSIEEALPQMLNRIIIRVFVDEPENPVLNASRPVAELTRIFDPIQGRPEDVVLEDLLKLVERAQQEEAQRGGGR